MLLCSTTLACFSTSLLLGNESFLIVNCCTFLVHSAPPDFSFDGVTVPISYRKMPVKVSDKARQAFHAAGGQEEFWKSLVYVPQKSGRRVRKKSTGSITCVEVNTHSQESLAAGCRHCVDCAIAFARRHHIDTYNMYPTCIQNRYSLHSLC